MSPARTEPQWECLCGFRSDAPGMCCGGPLLPIAAGCGETKAVAWGRLVEQVREMGR